MLKQKIEQEGKRKEGRFFGGSDLFDSDWKKEEGTLDWKQEEEGGPTNTSCQMSAAAGAGISGPPLRLLRPCRHTGIDPIGPPLPVRAIEPKPFNVQFHDSPPPARRRNRQSEWEWSAVSGGRVDSEKILGLSHSHNHLLKGC